MLTVTLPAESYLLASLDDAKREMELTGTADDAVLAAFLRQASAEVARFCRRNFQREGIVQTFKFHYGCATQPVLLLDRTPVTAIASVDVDGVALAPSDYEVEAESGKLHRLSSGYEVDWWGRRITVAYTGGYAPGAIPGDVERATLDLTKRMFYGRSRDPALRGEQVLDVINQQFTAIGSEQTEDGLPIDVAGRLRAHRVF